MEIYKKQEKIIQMFNDIAPTYDRANRILSMGIDISWRKKACDKTYSMMFSKKIDLIVDVACGTGDMMGFWQKRADKKKINLKRALGIDPSSEMLNVAKKKFPNFDFAKAEAVNLPLPNACADILSISYGIRNVIERQKAFKEFARVVKDGGFVVILEFTKDNRRGFLYSLKQFYLHKILPFLGAFISKNYEAYKYLPNSIENFLTVPILQDELKEAGFEVEYVKNFSFNISTLLIAKKCL
ncbi:MAG: bifunctional demethylmenaquinone methyltransferase/2-methoxy-6-polyprenyl-1,4-benzoquinol methylase UbiE [Campylobacteraceae bacterium]|nr:bifunctional demethylmenaquinone methyltransferase/2-methoxy-6-polyprenyl-1,4-benzoquinol methylase UbiE [Campylobacteraceae bacterium]